MPNAAHRPSPPGVVLLAGRAGSQQGSGFTQPGAPPQVAAGAGAAAVLWEGVTTLRARVAEVVVAVLLAAPGSTGVPRTVNCWVAFPTAGAVAMAAGVAVPASASAMAARLPTFAACLPHTGWLL